MTKAELIKEIEKKTGIDKKIAGAVVESFMAEIKDSLTRGDSVYLRGFGSFGLKHRATKTARNIGKNVTIIVPEHDIPYFKPAAEFVTAVKKTE